MKATTKKAMTPKAREIATDALFARIEANEFENATPYPTAPPSVGAVRRKTKREVAAEETYVIALAAYRNETYAREEAFRRAALAAVGLRGHRRAAKAYELAWDRGHADGLHDVLCYLFDLADLLL